MNDLLNVLLLEDNEADVSLMLRELDHAGFQLTWQQVTTAVDFERHLVPEVDVILADYSLPQFDAPGALQLVKQSGHDLPVIVVTGTISEEVAVECMKLGAADYLLKDRLVRLGPAVRGAIEQKAMRAEQRQAEEEIRRQVERLRALRAIDLAITSTLDSRVTFDVLLDQITRTMSVDAADILLFEPESNTLRFAAGRGFRTAALQHTHLRIGEGEAGRAALERRIVQIRNLASADTSLVRAGELGKEGFVSYMGVPLLAKGQVKGVLEVFHRQVLEPDPDWHDFLEALAGQAAIAIDNSGLFDRLQHANIELTLAYDATIEGWARALELRDFETEGHSRRVTDMTMRLARRLGFPESELAHVRRGALLHDIGKMGIPDDILLKPGPLTDSEWETMRRHPQLAFDLLAPISFLRLALDIPYCHHEKWDGSGYPRGLRGETIPRAARVFAVVDVWDALTSDRPYRPAWSQEKVGEYMREQSGKHFDPPVLETFLALPLPDG